MRRGTSTTVAILLGIIGFCSLSVQAQVVSYVDATGKRVYINANPKPVAKMARVVASKGASGAAAGARTTPGQPAASSDGEAVAQAERGQIDHMVSEVASRYNVDPALIRAVIETESNGDPGAVSTKGALGLMQLVPTTAQEMGVDNALDPKQNIDGGVRYLRMLLKRYKGDLDKALAAYNAGPGAVDRAGGVPRYRETRAYVQKVTDSYFRPGSNRLPTAFTVRHPIYRVVESDGRVVFTNQ
jgi:soluble lytic murein transglycosylase-like protein